MITYHVIAERGDQLLISTNAPPTDANELFPCLLFDKGEGVLYDVELYSALGQGYWEEVPAGTTVSLDDLPIRSMSS